MRAPATVSVEAATPATWPSGITALLASLPLSAVVTVLKSTCVPGTVFVEEKKLAMRAPATVSVEAATPATWLSGITELLASLPFRAAVTVERSTSSGETPLVSLVASSRPAAVVMVFGPLPAMMTPVALILPATCSFSVGTTPMPTSSVPVTRVVSPAALVQGLAPPEASGAQEAPLET